LASLVLEESGCWLWSGQTDRAGYARFSVQGRHVYVHRWSYEYHLGPIPEGLVLDHLCRTRNCANPYHLEPVTQAENMARGVVATKTHCKAGHPLVQVEHKEGRRRVCPVCKRASARASYQRRRPEALEYQRQYYSEHRDEIRAYQNGRPRRTSRPQAADGVTPDAPA